MGRFQAVVAFLAWPEDDHDIERSALGVPLHDDVTGRNAAQRGFSSTRNPSLAGLRYHYRGGASQYQGFCRDETFSGPWFVR